MKLFGRKQCPRCKTGRDSYEIDKCSPICPYIWCYSGRKCSMFVPIKKSRIKRKDKPCNTKK